MRRTANLAAAGISLVLVLLAFLVTRAEAPANEHFQRAWSRTDQPVAEGEAQRTWMWGPEGFTPALEEPYAESPGGARTVQYFDKSRMEITFPDTGDPSSAWYVTNGLLVVELVTGELQLGDAAFEQHDPATINVAGDPDDPEGPTYATFATVLDASPHPFDQPITPRIDRAGEVTNDPSLADHGVEIEQVDAVTNHAIAGPFWQFMNSEGAVFADGQYTTGPLFENPYFATGRPIAEPYWATVQVAGTPRDVLIQCFERRCLTYTPGNPEGWQVEAGNVGRHYHHWRYELIPDEVTPTPEPTATPTVTPTATPIPSSTASPTPTEPPPATTGDVRIEWIDFDPDEGLDGENENVGIQNYDTEVMDMTGWYLHDSAEHTYYFPDGFQLEPGDTVTVHICNGTDTATDLYWGLCSAVWNNAGDTGYIRNSEGHLIDRFAY